MKESGITCLIVLLLGGGAQAADLSRALPTKAPPAAVAVVAYDWTGFYMGGHLGYAGGSSDWTTSAKTQFVRRFDASAFLFITVPLLISDQNSECTRAPMTETGPRSRL